jgi:aspartyl/asparaginyl beta-hydroxylase (cupin superfamily)
VQRQAWVFDDSIEHEAHNDSDQLRVILILDTWHPMLSPEERQLITVLSQGLNAFSGDAGAGYGS